MLIQTIEPDIRNNLLQARSVIEQYVDAEVLNNYQLRKPDANKDVKYVVPISGGSDSSCLALVLRVLFPDINFIYIFADTLADGKEVYANLATLESYLGIEIHRTQAPLGLFQYIDKHNGYLPSQRNRYCTPYLKIKPIKDWFNKSFDLTTTVVYQHVGIRHDEDRWGDLGQTDSIQQVLPYVDMKIGREAVYGILSQTIGISSSYRWNSRSSCFCCFFKRRSEKIGLLIHSPEEFNQAASYEKLTDDAQAQLEFTHIRDSIEKVSLKHHHYFVPKAVDVRSAHLRHSMPPKPVRHKKDRHTLDLFDDVITEGEEVEEIYAAVSFFVHPLLNLFGKVDGTGVWWQELACYSPTLQGLKQSLLYYFEHKLGTSELYGISKSELKERLKIGLFQIKLPVGSTMMKPLKDGSYCWSSSESYRQVEHHTKLVSAVLHVAALEQEVEELRKYEQYLDFELTWQYERVESLKMQLSKYQDVKGQVTWSGLFDAPDESELPSKLAEIRKKDDDEAKAHTGMACLACSL